MSFLLQVELFEESDIVKLEDELNKFLEKLSEVNVLKVESSYQSLNDSLLYYGLVLYRVE